MVLYHFAAVREEQRYSKFSYIARINVPRIGDDNAACFGGCHVNFGIACGNERDEFQIRKCVNHILIKRFETRRDDRPHTFAIFGEPIEAC